MKVTKTHYKTSVMKNHGNQIKNYEYDEKRTVKMPPSDWLYDM